jgi:glyoxylase-like metal-dependent hydrolase (beta-lactamase superfamily II)
VNSAATAMPVSAPTLHWQLLEAGYCTHPERATRQGAPFQSCEFPALVALLQHPQHGNILFDTGYSEHFLRATAHMPERLYRHVTPVHLSPQRSVLAQLQQAGMGAQSIAHIVLSHLHGDHIGGLADFPGANVILSKVAVLDMQKRGRLSALCKGLLPALFTANAPTWIESLAQRTLRDALAPFGVAHDLFGDASVLLIALPGHAPGHFGLHFQDASGPVFLIADASWSSLGVVQNIPPPSLVTAWLGDSKSYRETLTKLHQLHISAPNVRIVPSHCASWRPEATKAWAQSWPTWQGNLDA